MKKAILAAVAWWAVGMTAGGLQAANEPMSAADRQQERAMDAGIAAEQTARPEGEVRSVRRLLGRNVQGLHGDRLGEVSEVLVDVPRGQIAYLVVTADSPGPGDQRRIVPWRAVFIHPQTASLTVRIDADRFRDAPAAVAGGNRQQAEEIHRFYGVAPYWQQEAPREPAPAMLPSEPEPRPMTSPPPAQSAPEGGETPLWFE